MSSEEAEEGGKVENVEEENVEESVDQQDEDFEEGIHIESEGHEEVDLVDPNYEWEYKYTYSRQDIKTRQIGIAGCIPLIGGCLKTMGRFVFQLIL